MPAIPSHLAFLPARPFILSPRALSRAPVHKRMPSRPLTMQATSAPPAHAYSVAPMMEVTDRHWRVLARLITRRATLYTEMVVDRTLIHNPYLRELELRLPPLPALPSGEVLTHHPTVLQLGGSVPDELEAAAVIAADFGYTEVNLNCGCPSPKVAGKGCFGAAMMLAPENVAEACRRMALKLPPGVPVTVKCRIGVDDADSYELLSRFVRIVAEGGGVGHFIIHARKAILKGLSPAQNRTVPPLKHDWVYRLQAEFPHLLFSINGGIREMSDVQGHLAKGVDGVMVGRGCMDSPWAALCDVDVAVYGDRTRPVSGESALTRRNVLRDYSVYAEEQERLNGAPARVLVRPLLNLFYCEPRGKMFRRVIDTVLQDKTVPIADVIAEATAVLSSEVLDKPPSCVAEVVEAQRVREVDNVSEVGGLDTASPAPSFESVAA